MYEELTCAILIDKQLLSGMPIKGSGIKSMKIGCGTERNPVNDYGFRKAFEHEKGQIRSIRIYLYFGK